LACKFGDYKDFGFGRLSINDSNLILIVVKRASTIMLLSNGKTKKLLFKKHREELYQLEENEIDRWLEERKACQKFIS